MKWTRKQCRELVELECMLYELANINHTGGALTKIMGFSKTANKLIRTKTSRKTFRDSISFVKFMKALLDEYIDQHVTKKAEVPHA